MSDAMSDAKSDAMSDANSDAMSDPMSQITRVAFVPGAQVEDDSPESDETNRAQSFAPLRTDAPADAMPVLEVLTFFRGVLTGARYLDLLRPLDAQARFVIGASKDADAPVDPAYLFSSSSSSSSSSSPSSPSSSSGMASTGDVAVGTTPPPSHVLVTAGAGGHVINLTSRMRGTIRLTDGESRTVRRFMKDHGPTLTLPQGATAELACGDTTFILGLTTQPRRLPTPLVRWRWNERSPYTLGSSAALGLFLLMLFTIPPDPRSLSLDLFDAQDRFASFRIKPPAEKQDDLPPWLQKSTATDGGAQGQRAEGAEGRMGKKTAPKRDARYAVKDRHDASDPHLAKTEAAARAASAGILGVLKANQGGVVASIFGRDPPNGLDAVDALGTLVGTNVGEAWGIGGLSVLGTGRGGGGTGENTIGVGRLATMGKWGRGDHDGPGYGTGTGALGRHHARAPQFIPGIADVRGSLDKEIIRRIIRRHLNEVKFCYEGELARNPELGGRIVVQFTIAGSGRVLASVLQTSTMKNARVETCTVNAVKRWEFPQPVGGGLVIVSYPFVLAPAGGES